MLPITACLNKDPDCRYPSVSDLLTDLKAQKREETRQEQNAFLPSSRLSLKTLRPAVGVRRARSGARWRTQDVIVGFALLAVVTTMNGGRVKASPAV